MSVTAVPIQPTRRAILSWLWIGIVVAIAAGVALAVFASPIKATESGLRIQTIQAGEGENPTDNDVVLVNYTGRLSDGTVFDQSQQPTPMPVSAVVPGFSEGLKQMQKGGKYRLWIPAELGYGASPQPGSPIPPNADLMFEVELIDFIDQQTLQQQMQIQQMLQGMQGPGGPGAPGGAGGPPPMPGGQ